MRCWKNPEGLFWDCSLCHGSLGCVGSPSSVTWLQLRVVRAGGDLGRLCPGGGSVPGWRCQHVVHLASVAGVSGAAQETKHWLQRGVEGTLWFPWVLPEAAGKPLRGMALSWPYKYTQGQICYGSYGTCASISAFGGRGKYGVLGTWRRELRWSH